MPGRRPSLDWLQAALLTVLLALLAVGGLLFFATVILIVSFIVGQVK